ncbi:hypothetical protein [Anaeromyxobacter terrae]|uniref:hypothetical protein n=1 Tax=Anaeromyxobacter terrae TaxID=2925406 RepID=UPI001F593D2A|nr:hypothetical protein [Anaeromyxobacter sp. SG22]
MPLDSRAAEAFHEMVFRTRDAEWISGAAANLALRVAFDDLRFRFPEFPAVVSGTVEGETLSRGSATRIEPERGELRVHLDGITPDLMLLVERFNRSNSAPTRSACLVLADGTEVTARIGHFVKYGGSSCVIRFLDWEVKRSEPVCWTAPVKRGSLRRTQGNLLIHERKSEGIRSSLTNLLLRGNYTWSLVGKDDEAFAIVETGGVPLQRRSLVADFCALELAFGQHLGIEWLTGVDADGNPVAWSGTSGLDDPGEKQAREPPIPVGDEPVGSWLPEFFAQAARALADDDATAWVFYNAYMDSLSEHLDGSYLKLQVALEALSSPYARGGQPQLVKDRDEWNAWVDEHADAIRSHAAGAGDSEKLLSKVKAAANRPTTDTVERAFATLALTLPPEASTEIRQRNVSAHRFLMNKPDADRDLLRDWNRVRMIRALLVAVFAKSIGYSGPIGGWERDALGGPRPAPWYPAADADRKHRLFGYRRMDAADGPSE